MMWCVFRIQLIGILSMALCRVCVIDNQYIVVLHIDNIQQMVEGGRWTRSHARASGVLL